MNRVRRKSLKDVLGKMDELSAVLENVKDAIQAVLDEEQEAYDNLPEGLQEAERGQQMQEYIEALVYRLLVLIHLVPHGRILECDCTKAQLLRLLDDHILDGLEFLLL